MEKNTSPKGEISFDYAITSIRTWREHVGDLLKTHGFLIYLDDLKALMLEIAALGDDALGVRAYLGRTNDDTHLCFVAVKKKPGSSAGELDPGKDVYSNSNAGSKIYDVTRPCPNMCDTSSLLSNAGVAKQEIQLADIPTPRTKKQPIKKSTTSRKKTK